MIRFVIRIAFLLGLIAFFLPGGNRNPDAEGVNYFLAFTGFQQFMGDVGGFCDRAPAACSAGAQIAGFVVNRVGDGLEYGYALARGQAPPVQDPAAFGPAPPRRVEAPMAAAAPVAAGAPAAPLPGPQQHAVPAPSPRPAG